MTEQADLESLLTHPGYLRLLQWAESEWEARMSRHVASAANDVDDLLALQKLRQVIAAQKAVQQLLAWPKERIHALAQVTEREHATAGASRRGLL